jgi:hypothetical protein
VTDERRNHGQSRPRRALAARPAALEIEAATSAAHRELGMTYNPLGMIPPHSELVVNGYLVPATEPA